MSEHEAIIAYARRTGNCPLCKGKKRLTEAGHRYDCPGCDGSGKWHR